MSQENVELAINRWQWPWTGVVETEERTDEKNTLEWR